MSSRFLAVSGRALGILLWLVCSLHLRAADDQPRMTAHFIKVGQADSTLLEFPCGAVLIDAGAQDDAFADHLLKYLDEFFDRRSDLTNTLSAVFVTHPHIDHTFALRRVAEKFRIKGYVDNGQTEGSGIANIKFVRKNAPGKGITLREAVNSEIMMGGNKAGITDGVIDPLHCDRCDPAITVYSGQWDNDPNWSQTALNNKNNHSLVIRVDFGNTSLLFTGDLEAEGIKSLLDYYGTAARRAFDVDLYHIGHHGSRNATTQALLDVVTPEIAVVSVGKWDFGRQPPVTFSTFAYGHPNRTVVSLVSASIPVDSVRSTPAQVMLGNASKSFTTFKVTRRVYATDWDGDITVGATLQRIERVTGHR
jgi:beta-lactamase superfamily II metal-dependent hydrolase